MKRDRNGVQITHSGNVVDYTSNNIFTIYHFNTVGNRNIYVGLLSIITAII